MIFHPRNPHAPTSHMNLRLFVAGAGDEAHWWFGGGFDLTPIYGVDADAIRWHQAARNALQPFGEEVYPAMKSACDDYFCLRHRKEQRGIGGVFYDDLNEGGYDRCRDLSMAVGEAFLATYFLIVEERLPTPYSENERRLPAGTKRALRGVQPPPGQGHALRASSRRSRGVGSRQHASHCQVGL